MALFFVDDRDGRILFEVETEDDVQRILEAWARDDGSIPDYLCLVELRSHDRAVFGADSSVKIRPLLGA
jgi:hypothetical protein